MLRIISFIKKNRLTRRLLLYVLTCCFFLIFFSTFIQLYINYQNDLESIHDNFNYIESFYLPGISNAVFTINRTQIDINLRGIMGLEGVSFVEIIEKRGDKQFRTIKGDERKSRDILKTFPLVYGLPRDEQIKFGHMTVAVNLEIIRQRLFMSGLKALAFSLMGIGLVATSILLIFHVVLTRRIVSLKNFTEQINLNELDVEMELKNSALKTEKPDELQQLITAINAMRLRLIQGIAERIESERAIEMEKERLGVTLRSIGDGVISTDVDGKVVLINSEAEKMTGWTQSEAMGAPLDRIFHIINEKTGKRCSNPVEKVLETKGMVGLANDTLLIARDGTERIIADSGSPICDNKGDTIGVVLVFRDTTEKIEMEAELRHAHKMEAVGNLAGGIAHEFNNILSIIIGNAELAIDDIETGHPIEENLYEIKMATLRGKDVVKQLLNFSRKAEINREPIDIRIIVKESLKLLRASIPSNISMNEILPPGIDTIVADPTQIHQLLINLCSNAAQAMNDDGGILTIQLKVVFLDHLKVKNFPDLKPGNYVRISVKDTGHGIPEEMRPHIFDPYFTTKDVDKGTGLGLAVVHGIVKTHDAAIDVESIVGKGTVFHVYFPSVDKPVIQTNTEAKSIPKGNGNVIFVDDDVSLVMMCDTMLRRLGYDVTVETNPLKALARFRSNPIHYDLVITDMTMPEMTGGKLAHELLKIRPDVPIIICTGYSEKMSLEKAQEIGAKGLLLKPIGMADLGNMVKNVLDEVKS